MSSTDFEKLMIEAEESINEIETWARQTEIDTILDPLNAGDFALLREKIADARNQIIRVCLSWQQDQRSSPDEG